MARVAHRCGHRLKSQSRGATASRSHHRLRQLLIVTEVTLALVLLGGAAVMQRGFDKFLQKDVGWDTKRLLTGALPMSETRFPDPAQRLEFFRKIEARLAALPGVEAVALTTGVPIWGYGNTQKIQSEKLAGADPAKLPLATHTMVTANFFKALGVAFVEGRDFAPDIKPGDPKVVVVNEHLAREMWPGRSALGQRLATVVGTETTWSEIIGVVRDTDSAAPFDDDKVKNQVFRSVVHEPWAWIRFAIRAESPAALADSVRRAVAEVDPDLPADDVGTATSAVDQASHNVLVIANLLKGFAALGLVLAAVGLYGVISNLVAQRTSEFGIRLALGAKPSDVLRLVLRHGLTLTAIGLGVGLVGAYGLNRVLGAVMPRIVSPDPLVLLVTAAALLLVALLACWLPARRATKVDPMVALRSE